LDNRAIVCVQSDSKVLTFTASLNQYIQDV